MKQMASSDIEKKSLEAHVELCAERYKNLDDRLCSLDDRMGKIESLITEVKTAIASVPNESSKTFIAIGTTVLGALIGVIGTLVIHIK
jgi:prefoldin subunit 5